MAYQPIPPAEWTDSRHREGYDAEVRAGHWLQARGWQVEAHRFRLGRNDLDLIVRRGQLVAFVEVKARRTTQFGDGLEAVGPRKRRVIERLAWAWILRYGAVGDQYRFDVLVVRGGESNAVVEHLADAWRPGWR